MRYNFNMRNFSTNFYNSNFIYNKACLNKFSFFAMIRSSFIFDKTEV